jgi:2-oxoisovalerate dehydrogenase E2 component (dihydrolipoyl transacylase)
MADIREFRVPDLGEGLEDAHIVEWHVEVGDEVELNQDVCEVETAKALVAIPSPFAGRVVERFGEVGQTVDVGQPLLRVEVAAVSAHAPEPEVVQTTASNAAEPRDGVLVGYGAERGSRRRRRRVGSQGVATDQRTPMPAGTPKPLAKPPVRKLAKELDVDLSAIAPGSGPGGSIARGDVEAAARAAAAPERIDRTIESDRDTEERIPIRGIRARIAQKMVTSRTEIPEATCSITVDCTNLLATSTDLTKGAISEGVELKVTPLALILKGAAISLRRFREVNSRFDAEADEIVLMRDINLGVATDTERGLMVPVIKRADARTTLELSHELTRLVEAARSGSIRPDDLTGGTFTVNNYGSLGAEDGEPIINHPEAAILGIGAIKERPWVVDGELVVRRIGRLTLAFDHRIFDGGAAARFLAYIGELMEHPARLLLHC